MTVLVVIDMQNDFIDGPLGTPEAQAIVPRVAGKILSYKEMGAPIIFTRDTHFENYLSTNEGRKQPIVHCIEGTPGWQVSDALDTDDSVILDKTAFGALNLPQTIETISDVTTVEVVGLCTDMCVVSNALILRSAFPEQTIVVDASCCAGSTPEKHRHALEVIKACQILVVNE